VRNWEGRQDVGAESEEKDIIDVAEAQWYCNAMLKPVRNCQTFAGGWKEGTRVSIESMEDGAL
jgi:hypothetical protein